MDDEERQKNKEGDKSKDRSENNTDLNSQEEKHDNKEKPKVSSTTCKLVATERLKVVPSGHRINAQIQYVRDNDLIGKFIGLWPTEKVLCGWITVKWNPKGHITLQLGPKGFFTTIFNCVED